jgi:hypothetical protein
VRIERKLMERTAQAPQNSVGKTIRRLIQFLLLFVLVTLAAIGLAGLLERAIDAGVVLTDGDTAGLATWLAFALIAGPLAAVLWWLIWRSLRSHAERDALLWGLYLAGMSTLSLILGVSFLLSTAAVGVSGAWDPQACAAGVVWIGVWAWHVWMAHQTAQSPTRLTGGARTLGYVFGIAIGAAGWIQLVAVLINLAIAGAPIASSVGESIWTSPMQSGVWVVGGALVWWWHWVFDGGSRVRTGFATVVLVLVTGLTGFGLAVGGVGTAIYVGLRVVFDANHPLSELLDPLGAAVGATSIGAILVAYFRKQLSSFGARLGTQLVSSGVALAAAATGVGIIINSVLAATKAPLVESDSLNLLFSGISALVVGGPAWWWVWRPLAPATRERARETGRRIFLIAVFGVSALVSIIVLLVIGYQIFDFFLSHGANGSLLEGIRASLGLLIATGLVAGYHFSVWRGDRVLVPSGMARTPTVGRVVLVAGPDHDDLVRAIRSETGAAVTVLTRSDDSPTGEPLDVVAALEGITGSRVLVVTIAKKVHVIPLEN